MLDPFFLVDVYVISADYITWTCTKTACHTSYYNFIIRLNLFGDRGFILLVKFFHKIHFYAVDLVFVKLWLSWITLQVCMVFYPSEIVFGQNEKQVLHLFAI